MAEGVEVDISDAAIITALNTPGGAIFAWRDEIGEDIRNTAIRHSPVNDPLNAVHRGGGVGTYKAGWRFNRVGSSGHTVRANVFNLAPHSVYVEYGRTPSYKLQIFSWTEWQGDIRRIGGPKPMDLEGMRLSKAKRAFLEARNQRLAETLPEYAGAKTSARVGRFVLTRAVAAALGSVGIRSVTGV